MIDLTIEQISAAKNNDLAAVTAIIEATEERVIQLARRYATMNGRTDFDTMDDLAQIGRMAIWEGLKRFNGTTVAEFFTFVDSTAKGHMTNERKSEQRQGVSRETAAQFEKALTLADGDVYLAEKIAQDPAMMTAKRRMTAETAYAARLSYQGIVSLDVPVGGGQDGLDGDMTLADMLAEVGVPADLLEPSDYVRARRERTKVRVHSILNGLGRQAQVTLKAMAGVDPVGYYGNGETEPFRDEEMCADHGIPLYNVRAVRSKATRQFRERYELSYPF